MSNAIATAGTPRHQPARAAPGARYTGTALVCVALVLMLLQSMLYVATGWGVEDFLGWSDLSDDGPVHAMLKLWHATGMTAAAYAYLAVDTLVFVPVYSAFFAMLALHLADGLAPTAQRPRAASVLLAALAAPLLALIAADLIENGFGMARLAAQSWYGWLAGAFAAIIALLFLRKLAALNRLRARLSAWALVGAAILLAAMLASGWFSDTCRLDDAARSTDWSGPFGCAAHCAKQWLTALLLLVMLAGASSWLFGVRVDRAAPDDGLREARARLRAAIGDMLLRSRYVLIALAALAGLTVAMDQGRDVVYAVAAAPFGENAGWRHWAGALAVFGASIVAAWLMMFACWLWTRSVCQLQEVHGTPTPEGDPAALRPEDYVARDWARFLALMPLLILILLCAGVVRDSATALSAASQPIAHGTTIVAVVLLFGVVALALGLLFIRMRIGKEEMRYYDALSWDEWRQRAGFAIASGQSKDEKYSLVGLIDPYWLPIVAAAGMLVCRLISVWPSEPGEGYMPTMTLPIIMFALALWLCFFGWLSLLEVRQSMPWVGLLIVVIGALGLLGLTDNHLVWPAIANPGEAHPEGALRMLAFTALLALLLMAAYVWTMHLVKDMTGHAKGAMASGRPRKLVLWGPPPILLLVLVGIVAWADQAATTRAPGPPAKTITASRDEPLRPTLDEALASWLLELCQPNATGCDWKGFGKDGSREVYFVSTEGGGIRAAAWTALALQQFAKDDPDFRKRTFSLSGVSGGAIGAAAFRACSTRKTEEAAELCVKGFAQTDLLAPLLSAWMFEDALARVLPTRWCKTPSCGFLSRGAWFEQAMESSLPEFRKGLAASQPTAHRPYLFLNSTWVESGERAIASDIRIDWERFGGAKDQLAIVGHDIPLGTAAHNAARFPYVNAIGALKTGKERCNRRALDPSASAPAAVPPPADDPQGVCGHLADGGYFDNSGGQATLDVLHGLARCLEVGKDDRDFKDFKACADIGDTRRAWLRQHLLPRVLMIRNSASPAAAREQACFDVSRPTGKDVAFVPLQGCDQLSNEGSYAPQRPICRPRSSLFVDLTGPAVTVLNVSGIGSNGQLAEARQTQAVQTLRVALGASAPARAASSATAIDLLPDGVRYPLGWHLSPAAVAGMARQANGCKLSRQVTPAATAASTAAS